MYLFVREEALEVMASTVKEASEQEQAAPRLQIYSTSDTISTFCREKYEKDARKYWDVVYKRHQEGMILLAYSFFKDRHYLDKEWGKYFSGAGRKVFLEVGCGAGNIIFPLVAMYADVFIHACDFSKRLLTWLSFSREDASIIEEY